MTSQDSRTSIGHRLIQLGVLLFLLGLLTGFTLPMMQAPRLGLSSHLEGVMNGMFLMGVGLIWPRLRLGAGTLRATFWLAVYGTYANWVATLLSGVWGAGAMMPLAGGGATGTATQELIMMGLLVSLAAAMVVVCVLLLVGLRAGATER